MKILVTGATGYIGKRFTDLALAHGHLVVAASRRPLGNASGWLQFDLSTPAALAMPDDVDVVLHLAIDTRGVEQEHALHELTAAKILIDKTIAVGARFVFVSSQTAHANAPTGYGRTKWAIEQEVLATQGVVVRPGQVYGGPESGLFGTLANLLRSLPVLPAFMPAPMIQPLHVDDCARGLLRLAIDPTLPPALYCIAEPTAIPFTDFLRCMARERVRRARIFVPVPSAALGFARRLLGRRIAGRLGLERLSSLFELRPMQTATDLQTLGLQLRPLADGMHRSGDARRRRLLREGAALLTYIMKRKPDSGLVRRYARAVLALSDTQVALADTQVALADRQAALPLPPVFLRWPFALAFIDDRNFFAASPLSRELGRRLDTAMVVAEASIAGASRFLGRRNAASMAGALLGLARAGSLGVAVLILRTLVPWRYSAARSLLQDSSS